MHGGNSQEPSADRRGIFEAIPAAHAVSDRDGDPACVIDGLEAILIGEIIADEYGVSA